MKEIFLNSKTGNINEMIVEDFVDYGFSRLEATAIYEKRREVRGFEDFSSFKTAIEGDLARAISGLNNKFFFGKEANRRRQLRALDRLEKAYRKVEARVLPVRERIVDSGIVTDAQVDSLTSLSALATFWFENRFKRDHYL
jgi:hypothetical protein